MSCRYLFAIAAVCMLGLPCTGAADSVTVAIHTTVLPVCRFSASAVPDSMSGADAVLEGSIGAASITRAITYRCTNGVAPAFTITAASSCEACGAPVTLSDSGNMGRGMGSGRELMLVVTGPSTMPAPFQTASLGFASNDVSITVSP